MAARDLGAGLRGDMGYGVMLGPGLPLSSRVRTVVEPSELTEIVTGVKVIADGAERSIVYYIHKLHYPTIYHLTSQFICDSV